MRSPTTAALAIKTDTQVLGGDSGINAGLAMVYRDLNQPNVAIAYYKDAINGIQLVRRNIQGLPPQLQNSFLQATYDFGGVKVSDIYRQLADLLRQQGLNTEALQVVELLKIQELREFTRSVDKKTDIPLSRGEQQIKQLQTNLIAFGQRVYECEQQKCPQLQSLITQRDNLNRESLKKVSEIEKSINFKDPNLIYPGGNLLNDAKKIVEAQPDTIMVYPVVLSDKIVIFLASKGVVVKSIEVKGIGQQQLATTVKKYRELLKSPSDVASVKATSKQLYDWLIKPIEAELKNNKIQNLVFALDSSTRYIPMSTLFDGSKYLVENYQISTVISASLTNLGEPLPPGKENTPVLAVGLSDRVTGYDPLPNVPKELEAIVHENTSSTGIYPGLKLLNKAFDFPALRSNLEGKKILHIATHGAFVPNDPTASYILSGTGEKIPITDIQLLQNLGNIHLVVLSACETALGGANQNGVEISGISSFFVGNGKAKAAIASLWQVNDASTTLLMQQFYRNLASGKMTKAEALRQAQLSLLYGKDSRGNINQRSITVTPIPGKPARVSDASGFSHPFYWAPFILIGNGL